MLAPIAAVINQSDSLGGKMIMMKKKSLEDGEVKNVRKHKKIAKDLVA